MKKGEKGHKLIYNLRAQGGLNAAILVAVIAAVIIIYILFLPTEDRKDLLGEDSDFGGSSAKEKSIELLSESVGRLDPVGKVRDKDISNVKIFETTNSKILEKINPITIRNGWFDKKIKIVKFTLNDFENTDNVLLSFSAPVRRGILSIKLNGELIYEYDINSLNVEPIRLKKNLLSSENELEFSVSSVGAKFWTTNEYSLENVKLIGDITDLTRQESSNVFTLTDIEYQNLEKAEIRFIPYCSTVASVGVLDVFVNNRDVFSAVPVCNDRYKQDIPLSAFSAGQNNIIFRTNKGSYSIEQIMLSFTEKDTPEAVYYFEVNDSSWDKIKDNEYDSFVKIEFVDDKDRKRFDLNINDHLARVDQDEKIYEKNVDSWIENGNNFIKITPKTTLDVVEIKVELREN